MRYAQQIHGQDKAVWIHYRGEVDHDADLPTNPSLWDEYDVRNEAAWVWPIPAGTRVPQWIDP